MHACKQGHPWWMTPSSMHMLWNMDIYLFATVWHGDIDQPLKTIIYSKSILKNMRNCHHRSQIAPRARREHHALTAEAALVRVYKTGVIFVLLYGTKTCPLIKVLTKRMSGFDTRAQRIICINLLIESNRQCCSEAENNISRSPAP